MSNKRVSELAPITAPELNDADLLLLSDVSARESKKLQLDDLGSFLLAEGHISGSFFGTASYAENAGTASISTFATTANYGPLLLPSNTTPMRVVGKIDFNPGWFVTALTADFRGGLTGSNFKGTASWARNAILANTASFALTAGSISTVSSSFSNFAKSASYLIFTSGSTNGTASYAFTTSFCESSNTSSVVYQNPYIRLNVDYPFLGPASPILLLSSSNAVGAYNADTIDISNTDYTEAFHYQVGGGFYMLGATASRFGIGTDLPTERLEVVGNVKANNFIGTSSYALVAANTSNRRIDYGIFLAITQSITSSQLDIVSINPILGGLKNTEVEANGTVRVPFTGSSPIDGAVTLWALDRNSGLSQSFDSTPITAIIGYSSSFSGSLNVPFTLQGQLPLNGNYLVFVTASNGVFIDGRRVCRFDISSDSDQFSVGVGSPIVFTTTPSTAILLYSSSLHPSDAYQGSASQVTFSGSYDVTKLLVPPSSVTSMQYTWTLTSCSILIADGNSGLTNIGGLPSGMVSMSAANCNLTTFPVMVSSSISYLNIPNNVITTTLNLPPSMSYINVSNNFFTTLPTNLPAGLSALFAAGLGMSSTPSTMPDSIISMSFSNCVNLSTWGPASFPTSLYYLSASNTSLSNIPSAVPTPLLKVDVSNCQLGPIYVSNLAQGLVTNGLFNGILNFTNNPNSASALNITPNVATLRSRSWTVNGH